MNSDVGPVSVVPVFRDGVHVGDVGVGRTGIVHPCKADERG